MTTSRKVSDDEKSAFQKKEDAKKKTKTNKQKQKQKQKKKEKEKENPTIKEATAQKQQM